mgnify:CR=1 FL=1
MMKRYIIGICVCLAVTLASAQTRREMGGIYHAYPKVDVKEMSQTPSGYKPFYISHYGRHGSRWMTSDERYIKVAQYFDDESNLTPMGLKVKKLIIKARDNAMGVNSLSLANCSIRVLPTACIATSQISLLKAIGCTRAQVL